METKKFYKLLLLSFVFIFIAFAKGNFVHAANVYDGISIGKDVEANKSWRIKFNKELDKSTIKDSNISVTDNNGSVVPVSLQVDNNGRDIIVTPKIQYTYGKTYNLVIKNGLKAVNGKSLQEQSQVQFSVKASSVNTSKYTVTLDAGHGGFDSGNIGQSGVKEKDVDLSVALKVGKILKDNGVNVVYTRESDRVSWDKNTDLQARFDISNNAKSDLFLSIHVNSYEANTSTNGIETYYSNSDSIGKSVAQQVQDQLISNTGLANRGIKEGGLPHEILRGTSAPAVMVQLGFMTNPKESVLVGSDDFQNKSAVGIANGVLKSLNLIGTDKNLTISSVSDISASINVGDNYTLPTSVQATMNDNSTKKVGVIWDYNKVDSSKEGSYTYKGTIAGYSKSVIFTLTVVARQTQPIPPTSNNNTPIIVIDPGHGVGKDTGSTGLNGLQEDDVTLKVGLKVGKILESRGVNVVYTRTTDERATSPLSITESLQRRCDTANNANAKYLVSIHTNAFDDPAARGTETLYYTGNSEGQRLASAIQKNLVSALGTYNRGLKDGSWLYIAKNTVAPTALAELGFLTNPNDASVLGTDEGQMKAAQAVANGILEVLGM